MNGLQEFDDIDSMRHNLEKYYEKHDPDELQNIDDVIDMGMELGMNVLNQKMRVFYGESLSEFLQNIQTFDAEPDFPPPNMTVKTNVPNPYNNSQNQIYSKPSAPMSNQRQSRRSSDSSSSDSSDDENYAPDVATRQAQSSAASEAGVEVDAELQAVLKKFYSKHDPSRLERMNQIYTVATQIGIQGLNDRLRKLYGEDLDDVKNFDDDAPPPGLYGSKSPVQQQNNFQKSAQNAGFMGAGASARAAEDSFYGAYSAGPQAPAVAPIPTPMQTKPDKKQKKKKKMGFGMKAMNFFTSKAGGSSTKVQGGFQNQPPAQPNANPSHNMNPMMSMQKQNFAMNPAPAANSFESNGVWQSPQHRLDFEEDLLQFYLQFDPRKAKLLDQVMELADSIGPAALDDKLTNLYGMGPVHLKQYHKEKKKQGDGLAPTKIAMPGLGAAFKLKSTGINLDELGKGKQKSSAKSNVPNFKAQLKPVGFKPKNEKAKQKKIDEIKAVKKFSKKETAARRKLMSVAITKPAVQMKSEVSGTEKVSVDAIIDEARTAVVSIPTFDKPAPSSTTSAPKVNPYAKKQKKISVPPAPPSESSEESEDLDLGKIRMLILEFYRKHDPLKLKGELDVKEMVEFTFSNGVESLNDLLYSQYKAKIDIDSEPQGMVTNQNLAESYQMGDVSESKLVFKNVPDQRQSLSSERNLLTKRIRDFYEQHDKTKLEPQDIQRIVDYATFHGVEKLNNKLIPKYGEGIPTDNIRSEAAQKTKRLESQLLTRDGEKDFDELKMKQRLRVFYSKHDPPYLNDVNSLDKVIMLMKKIGKSVVEDKLEKLYGESVDDVYNGYEARS